jgi:hypothetical protein
VDRSKKAVAERLAQAHYEIEPGIGLIVQLEGSPQQESNPSEAVKLLEVNENTTSDGIRPVFFGSHEASGIFYASVIVEVTPDEYEQIRKGVLKLPNDWRLGREFAKPAPAAH